jgi:hypothetical protein
MDVLPRAANKDLHKSMTESKKEVFRIEMT